MGNGGRFIFLTWVALKLSDLARKMIRVSAIPDKDIKIQITGLRPEEKLYEELLNDASKTLPTHHHKIMITQRSRLF
jgi:FlaA1/EpsC-like NDP-sugar epimerase